VPDLTRGPIARGVGRARRARAASWKEVEIAGIFQPNFPEIPESRAALAAQRINAPT